MAKPAMIIDIIGKGPGDEEEGEPPAFDDEEGEDPEDSAPPRDPEEVISGIEQQLAELRRSVAGL